MLKNQIAWLAVVVTLALMAPAQLAAGSDVPSMELSPPNQSIPIGSRWVHVHDPSTVINGGDEFWVFSTGFGIPSFHSRDTLRWQSGPRVFERPPAWIKQAVPQHEGIYFWAPDIIRVGDRYLLYYAASVFEKNTSAIGLATSPTLNPADPAYQWTDQGMVVLSTRTNDFNAIDPAVFQGGDGKLWLAFGSFWSGIKLIQLDPQTCKRLAGESPLYSLAHADSIEAPYIYHHGDYYYLFVNWGRCCLGLKSTYSIHVGRSDKITGPYLDRRGSDLLTGGGSLFLGTTGPFIGPGHAGIFSESGKDWFSCHFYDGTRGGRSTLALLPLHWETNGWPEIVKEPK